MPRPAIANQGLWRPQVLARRGGVANKKGADSCILVVQRTKQPCVAHVRLVALGGSNYFSHGRGGGWCDMHGANRCLQRTGPDAGWLSARLDSASRVSRKYMYILCGYAAGQRPGGINKHKPLLPEAEPTTPTDPHTSIKPRVALFSRTNKLGTTWVCSHLPSNHTPDISPPPQPTSPGHKSQSRHRGRA